MGDISASVIGGKDIVKRVVAFPAMRSIRRAWSFSAVDHEAHQHAEFVRMYNHARRWVPYYRERSAEYPPLASVKQSGFRDVLRNFPILPKSVVREHQDGMRSRRFALRVVNATSGTTGTPLRLPASLMELAIGRGVYFDWLRKISGSRHPKRIHLTGFVTPEVGSSELVWKDRISGDVYMSIYALTAERRRDIVALLERYPDHILSGYASAVYELSKLVQDCRISKRRVAVVTSEVLYESWRTKIEAVVCRRLYNFYGSQEGAHAAMECDEGALHIHPYVGIVEVLDPAGEEVKEGEQGRVVLTGLVRRSMPLIRYEIGDEAIKGPPGGACSCGLQWPSLRGVIGRSEDLVLARDGRRIGYLAFHATKDAVAVAEAQLTQHDYERFTFKIVLRGDLAPSDRDDLEAHIRHQLTKRIGCDVAVAFQYTDHIPRGANGKLKAVVVDAAFRHVATIEQ